jgi:capsular polysaccharide biosynthesis protein
MFAEEITPERGSMYSPQRIVQIIRRRLWTIVLVAVVAVGSALGFSLLQTPTYEASVQILVGQKTTSDTNLGSDVSGLQELALTVAKAVPTTPVAEAVVERLDLPEGSAEKVLRHTTAEPEPGTMFVNVSYRDSDPRRAQLIANTIGQALSERISEVSLGANAITARVWEPATLPETPVSPDPIRNGTIALVLGSLLGVMLAFMLEYMGDRWNSKEEAEKVSGAPVLGAIPRFRVSARRNEILASKEGER